MLGLKQKAVELTHWPEIHLNGEFVGQVTSIKLLLKVLAIEV